MIVIPIAAACGLVALALFRQYLCGLAFILASMAALAAKRIQDKSPAPGPLPQTVGKVFDGETSMTQAGLDLWQAGANGPQVMEAIYLESRERYWRTTLAEMAVLAAIPYVIYLFAVRSYSVATPAVSASWFVFEWSFMVFLIRCQMANTRAGVMKWHLWQWRRLGRILARFAPDTGHPRQGSESTFVMVFIAIVAAAGIAVTIAANGEGHRKEWTAAVAFLAVAGTMWIVQRLSFNRWLRQYHDTLAQSAEAFECFMRVHMAKDSDHEGPGERSFVH